MKNPVFHVLTTVILLLPHPVVVNVASSENYCWKTFICRNNENYNLNPFSLALEHCFNLNGSL